MTAAPASPHLLSREQVAARLGVSVRAFKERLRSGALAGFPPPAPGLRHVWRRKEIILWEEHGEHWRRHAPRPAPEPEDASIVIDLHDAADRLARSRDYMQA